jgi:hypothetical protein
MDFMIDEDSTLERVDEYTLYCHYLEFQPDIKINYSSPLRDDDDSPSFGIFPSKKLFREFFWKDAGGNGDSGDIFKLIQRLFGYNSREEALARVLSDFGLGETVANVEKIVKHVPKPHNDCDIRVQARAFKAHDLVYWSQFNITESLLQQYRVSPLYCYWLSPSQKAPVFPSGLSFVYRIYDRYQLYFPHKDKQYKFRNDLTEHHVMGMQQLTYSTDTLIITKSYKDVMCLRSYGYDSVSPRSENTPMPDAAFPYFKERYKHILVLFDNDMKHRGDWYPFPQIYIPIETGAKDISDFTRDYSPHAAAELLKQLIG